VTPAASRSVDDRVRFSRTDHRPVLRRAIKNRYIK